MYLVDASQASDSWVWPAQRTAWPCAHVIAFNPMESQYIHQRPRFRTQAVKRQLR